MQSNEIISYEIPKFRTVNTELKDFSYYTKQKFEPDHLFFDFSFEVTLVKKEFFKFFLHVAYIFDKNDGKTDPLRLYHTDHIVVFRSSLKNDSNKFKIEQIANLLGVAYILSRGVQQSLSRGYVTNGFPTPQINPTLIIKETFKLGKRTKFVTVDDEDVSVESFENAIAH